MKAVLRTGGLGVLLLSVLLLSACGDSASNGPPRQRSTSHFCPNKLIIPTSIPLLLADKKRQTN